MSDNFDQDGNAGRAFEIADLRLSAKRARRIARCVDEGAAGGIRELALALEAQLRELENAIRAAATS